MNTSIPVHTLVLVALAFAATLILAGLLTPRSWWRRLTAGTLALVVGATWVIAAGLLHLFPPPTRAATAAKTFVVAEALNLRAAHGTASARLAVIPAGALIRTTGLREGDWLQLRAEVDGRILTGWSNSLWLRRTDEAGMHVDVKEHSN